MESQKMLSPVIVNKERYKDQILNKEDTILIDKIYREKLDTLNKNTFSLDTDLVRPVLVESWIRCKEHGLDLYKFNFGPVIDEIALEELLKERHLLLTAADPYIDELEGMLSNNPSMVLLSDENGIMLRVVPGKHRQIIDINERLNLVPGVRWAEDTVGTCGHSITLSTGAPFQICGPEHYCGVYDHMSCSSAPILDANNNIAGTLSIVSPQWHQQNSHSLGLVVSMAWAIQNKFQLALNNQLMGVTLGASDEAILTVNRRGIITNANDIARKNLRYLEIDLVGMTMESVLGRQPLIESVMETGKAVQDREIEIEKWSEKLHLRSAKPIMDNHGNIYGLIIVLKKIDVFKKGRVQPKVTETRFTFDHIIGESEQLLRAVRFARKIARLDANILIQGESGTGKEVFAQAIHNEGRPYGPFIGINCAAIPQNLIESELFGYEGGAFTGAERRGRPGKIELANGGTLFLDEIGDMPLELQPVLLRVLEEKKLMRVGGSQYIPVDFRLIAASNRDLQELISKNQFRNDLYYRLEAFKIYIPPLKDRGKDIINLAENLIAKIAEKQHIAAPVLNDETKVLLLQYNWPGNVRQLENFMLYAVNMSDSGVIQPEDLPAEISQNIDASTTRFQEADSLEPVKSESEDTERSTIIHALVKTGYHVSDAAKILKMSRSTLYRKIKEYELHSVISNKG